MSDPAYPLRERTIVLGVTGGIAAYKAVELARLLAKADARVHVIMTERARHFVGPLTFQALTGNAVFTDLFSLTQESEIGHIQIADVADLFIVAPATASAIARMAAGMADDALTSALLATCAPILVAPSMNVNMWQNPLTQANLARLVEVRGVATVGPGSGFLACRWVGPGRMAEPADIVEAAARRLTEPDLAGRRVAVSAGPTHEAVDPVRFLSNRSTGKMGYAVAAAAARRGAEVILVSGPVSLTPPPGVEVVSVITALDMERAMGEAAARADAVVMTGAVADFRPREVAAHKRKKGAWGDAPAIELAANPDILAGLGAARAERGAGPVLVGFAAETQDVVAAARRKLADKRVDLIVANDVSADDAGFGADTNRVILVDGDGDEHVPLADKRAIAHRILDRVVGLLGDAAPPDEATEN